MYDGPGSHVADFRRGSTGRHARASRVVLRLDATGDRLVLEVADDGVGFDPSGPMLGRLGLRSTGAR